MAGAALLAALHDHHRRRARAARAGPPGAGAGSGGDGGADRGRARSASAESPAAGDVPQPCYGYTTDFIKVVRDPRGHAKWPAGDGLISAWREGPRLYLFAGKDLHIMKLPVSR